MNRDYRIVPIRSDFAVRARALGLDDQGQGVEYHTASGGEPCRDVLRGARPGEALILASYGPFAGAGPYREFGPVYILASDAAEPVDLSRLPVDGAAPYFTQPFALRAYCRDERIIDAVITPVADARQHLRRLLALPRAAFVHARFGAYGCYACRIEAA
jgi:hypothetical protein